MDGPVVIEFYAPALPLNANRYTTRRQQIADKIEWREAAQWATVAAFPGKGPKGRAMPPCEVLVSIPVRGNLRRDPHNWYPTVKAIVDGVRLAGCWPDDNSDWVKTLEPQLRVTDERNPKVLVVLSPLPSPG